MEGKATRLKRYASILLMALLMSAMQAALAAETIPVIGCPSDGQMGPIAPPANSTAPLDADAKIAQQLAYYQAAESPRVLAPRGWNCFGTYGSSGEELIVAPARIESSQLSAIRVTGPGISMTHSLGGTSGRFDVAKYAARFFPTRAHDFVSNLERETKQLDLPELDKLPSFDTDTYRQVSPTLVRFETPGARDGVGTRGTLVKSADSVSGAIALTGDDDEPDLSILRVRLAPEQRALTETILQLLP
jgi:hypothetical protein